MESLLTPGALLFESCEDEERVRVACSVAHDDGLLFAQESEGELTRWSFNESPHRIEIRVGAEQVGELLAHYQLDRVRQLPAVFRLEFVGHDCLLKIRDLLASLRIGYEPQDVWSVV